MRFEMEHVRELPWGAAYEREFDLVMAANVMNELRTGETVYNDQMNARLAERLSPLDGALEERYLGVIPVPPSAEPYRRCDEILAKLAEAPRGHWAVLEMDGKYDAYMSDGIGGTATASGHKFQYSRPDAPRMNFRSLYGEVLSMAAYRRRETMEREITEATFASHRVAVGTTVDDVYMVQKRWKKATYLAPQVEGYPGKVLVEARRPGVKATKLAVEPGSFVRLFKVPYAMPAAYEGAVIEERLKTLEERRIDAANQALTAELEASPVAGIAPRTMPGYWRAVGDVMECPIYLAADKPGSPSGRFAVTFAPGDVEVIESAMDMASGYELQPYYAR
jgi:hypothetical protein